MCISSSMCMPRTKLQQVRPLWPRIHTLIPPARQHFSISLLHCGRNSKPCSPSPSTPPSPTPEPRNAYLPHIVQIQTFNSTAVPTELQQTRPLWPLAAQAAGSQAAPSWLCSGLSANYSAPGAGLVFQQCDFSAVCGRISKLGSCLSGKSMGICCILVSCPLIHCADMPCPLPSAARIQLHPQMTPTYA